MLVAAPVTIVISGRRVDASSPALVRDGVIVAPLVPYVREIAERIDGDGGGRRFVARLGSRSVAFTIGLPEADFDGARRPLPVAPYLREGEAYVPIAAIARALGGSAAYDGPSHTLSLVFVPEPLTTMTPLAHYVAPPGPLPTFTPKATPAPQPVVTGIPRPRRTPILIEPE
jgi:hypothetical protein